MPTTQQYRSTMNEIEHKHAHLTLLRLAQLWCTLSSPQAHQECQAPIASLSGRALKFAADPTIEHLLQASGTAKLQTLGESLLSGLRMDYGCTNDNALSALCTTEFLRKPVCCIIHSLK